MSTIRAISFLHKGERVVIKASKSGKFKVPVTKVVDGQLRTNFRLLPARDVIEHDIIKDCDPTLYLDSGEKLRVYIDADSKYLPALIDGVLAKHDQSISTPKVAKKTTPPQRVDKSSEDHYNNGGFYLSWPDDDDYYD
mgnify:CR=1 FL=1